MSQFGYIAISDSGQRIQGMIRSHSDREAVKRLLEMGYHPLSVEPAATTANEHWLKKALNRIKVTDLAVFTRQLSALLKAGLPMLHALSTLRRQSSNSRLAKIVQDIEDTISQDAGTLSDALDNHSTVFDPVYRGLVRSGEESGNLAEVLSDLSRHLTSAARLRGQVTGAFIYPIFLIFMGTGAIFVLMTFVIPRFQDLFESFGQSLPWPTRMLVVTSGFLASWWWAVISGVLAAILMFLTILRKPRVRFAFDKLVLKLPVLGDMVLKLEVSRISRTLASLLASGIRIIEALRITGDTARNVAVRNSFASTIQGVSAGEPVAAMLEKSKIFPLLMVNLVKTGEDTGELPQMLSELAAIYEDESERAVSNAVKLLEPMLIVIMGGIIAAIVAAVILPIFQANAAIS